MPPSATQIILALAAILWLGGHAAQAQVAPVRYWIPGGVFGLGSLAGDGAKSYGDVPGFDVAASSSSGFSFRSYSVPTSSFAAGLGWNGIGGAGGFGNFGSLSQDGAQFGYNFKGAGGLPMTVFAGVETLNYNPDVFSAVTSFSPSSGNAPAYGVHAGVELRPTSNFSLSVSAGYAQQQSGSVDSGIRSTLLPGESSLFAGSRR